MSRRLQASRAMLPVSALGFGQRMYLYTWLTKGDGLALMLPCTSPSMLLLDLDQTSGMKVL